MTTSQNIAMSGNGSQSCALAVMRRRCDSSQRILCSSEAIQGCMDPPICLQLSLQGKATITKVGAPWLGSGFSQEFIAATNPGRLPYTNTLSSKA
jgi:hypothetical protein